MADKPFVSTEILLPKEDLDSFATIAVDQFSSNPQYWASVENLTKNMLSAYHLTLPELYLKEEYAAKRKEHQEKIAENMQAYLDQEVFARYPDSYIYIEREMQDGSTRRGLVGAIDLEQYDYNAGSTSAIRATEQTILERIPARVDIRKDAILELSHVLLLMDDPKDQILGFLESSKESLPKLYDFELMQNGGAIRGYLVEDEMRDKLDEELRRFFDGKGSLKLVIGDGNHSLAAAKTIWQGLKALAKDSHPARYALVELENIQDDSQVFEPIHRIVEGVDPADLIDYLQDEDGNASVTYVTRDGLGVLTIKSEKDSFPLGSLQRKLDAYLKEHEGEIDYVHDADEVMELAKADQAVGFLLDPISKDELFAIVEAEGSLPRKTFSMGQSREKRYYLEARKIKEDE